MPKLLDITNERYGKWVALYLHGYKEDPNTDFRTNYWMCQCDCGTVKPVDVNSLRKGRSKSCGCDRNPKGRPYHLYPAGTKVKDLPRLRLEERYQMKKK